MTDPLKQLQNAPALPSFADPSHANLIPFAIMCAGWFAPVLKFWALVLGIYRPYDYTGGNVAPNQWYFLVGLGLCLLPWWLPKSYYRIRKFEYSGRFYQALGVQLFRKLVPNGDWVNSWRRRTAPRYRIVSNRTVAQAYLARTILGEKSHLVLLLVGIATPMYALQIGWAGWAIYLSITNVIFHLYPILLQRYTRARLVRIL